MRTEPRLPRTSAYRAYEVGSRGRIRRVEVIAALDDADASAKTRVLAAGHVFELWDGARLVARFPSGHDQAAA